MSNLQTRNLTKTFNDVKAIDNITLEIQENKIYGLLGRNGAGKTTLLNLITSRLMADSGDITLDNQRIFENQDFLSSIFYMSEGNLYPETLKLKDIIKWTARFYPHFDIDYAKTLAKEYSLDLNKKFKKLSTGYQSIFKAILALSSNARIMLFDEPVLGLDATHRDMLYGHILKSYTDDPKTIIISTHLIEEIHELLEEIVIIKSGELIYNGSSEDLMDSYTVVAGEDIKVDEYIRDKELVEASNAGKYKTAVIKLENTSLNTEKSRYKELDFSRPQLQKLFISLTR